MEKELTDMLAKITHDLSSLVEINKAQTERIIDNSRMLETLFTRQLALEKAILHTLNQSDAQTFQNAFSSALRENG